MNPVLQNVLLSGGLYVVLQALVSGWFTKPKTKGEASQLEAGAEEVLTKAQISRQVNALQSAEDETKRAREACNKCEEKLTTVERRLAARDEATDALIDAVLEFLRLIPTASAKDTAPVRKAITTARRARHNFDSDG